MGGLGIAGGSGMPPVPLGAWASAYARLGVAVLPLRPAGKEPHGKLVPRGLKEATTDPSIIWGWWSREPSANIGLATGASGGCFWFALDIDGEEGRASLARLEAVHGPLPRTLATVTGSGGSHYLFALPPGLEVRNTASRLGPKIDSRGTGGYIVAPPSVHPNGHCYAWALGLDPWSIVMAWAPTWLAEFFGNLIRRAATPATPRAPWGGGHWREAPNSAYARAALRNACERVAAAAPGERNDALNREAFGIARFVAQGFISASVAVTQLADAARAAGLDPPEVARTLVSALRARVIRPAETSHA
jgi:hypothetical protein